MWEQEPLTVREAWAMLGVLFVGGILAWALAIGVAYGVVHGLYWILGF